MILLSDFIRECNISSKQKELLNSKIENYDEFINKLSKLNSDFKDLVAFMEQNGISHKLILEENKYGKLNFVITEHGNL